MPRTESRRTGTDEDRLETGSRRLAAIDPAVMARVVGRPEERRNGPELKRITIPEHRRPY